MLFRTSKPGQYPAFSVAYTFITYSFYKYLVFKNHFTFNLKALGISISNRDRSLSLNGSLALFADCLCHHCESIIERAFTALELDSFMFNYGYKKTIHKQKGSFQNYLNKCLLVTWCHLQYSDCIVKVLYFNV